MLRRRFFARVWAKLLAFERRHRLLAPGRGVLAAVSGGPDSVCLAHYLSERRRKLGFDLRLLHLHHGLRGAGADRDAAAVEALGRRLGAGVETVRASVRALAREERRSLEDAGRAARYRSLARAAAVHRLGLVATGHTLSDHAETVLLHLLRGTDPKGLLGIPVRRPLGRTPSPPGVLRLRRTGRLQVIRPLLCLTREEVLEYLRFFRLPSRRDPTNRDESLTRNWVRRRVVPLLKRKSPRLEEHLGLLSAKLRAAGGVVRPHGPAVPGGDPALQSAKEAGPADAGSAASPRTSAPRSGAAGTRSTQRSGAI